MSLLDALLLEPLKTTVWIALRNDQNLGDGTPSNPYNGGLQLGRSLGVSLTRNGNEGVADTGASPHGYSEGDMVQISGVTGGAAEQWNRVFGIYGVTPTTFLFARGVPFGEPNGFPVVAPVTFLLDKVLSNLRPYTRVNLGPSPRDGAMKAIPFQTRGYAPQGVGSWQPKSGQKIVGAGIDVTTVQLVGAGVFNINNNLVEQHFHAIGMPVIPMPGANSAISPLEGLEISNLTIDCNLDNQPLRGQDTFTPTCCGAVRILGNRCRVQNVKTINWGTKSLKQGCFVISMIGASGAPTSAGTQPIITETAENTIEECVAIQPAQNSARETTILHIGGAKNSDNNAQGFATGPRIRKNFIDCAFPISNNTTFDGFFLTGTAATRIQSGVGVFVSKRPHNRAATPYLRFYNPQVPNSYWNGYFQCQVIDQFQLSVSLDLTVIGGLADSSLVVMGTEFRAIAVTSANSAVVEDNHVHNCWIGGPYASPLDDSVNQPSLPPTLIREEHLDPFNALNVRSLMVRGNFFKNVAVGPYWNMGGLARPVQGTFGYDSSTGVVTAFTEATPKLWVGARVKIESAPDSRYEGLFEVTEIWDFPVPFASYFKYKLAPGLGTIAGGHANYRIVSGIDFLTIEDNIIELANLDETEFAIKEYPLPANFSAQTYRTFGIVVADNGLSAPAGPYAHRQVFIRNNKIHYVDAITIPTVPGIGAPAGAAMQLSGIKQLHVTRNVIDVNVTPSQRTYRSGTVRFFHNNRPDGELRRGWKWDTNGYYDEPQAIAQDALVLSFLQRRKS